MDVLFVDGDTRRRAAATESLSTVLTESTVHGAADRSEARSVLAERNIDCVVSRYVLPDTNGLELLREIREQRQSLPFVLFTDRGSETVARRAITDGVSAYVPSSAERDLTSLLADRITDLVEEYREERETVARARAVDAVDDAIGITDENSRFRYANDAFCELTGYERTELVGSSWSILFPEGEAASECETVLEAVETSGKWSGEDTWIRADGTHIVVEYSITASDVGELICTATDVTDTIYQQLELRREHHFVEQALNALEDVFYVLNTEGDIVWVNDAAIEVTGSETMELPVTRPETFFAPEDHQTVIDGIERTFEAGTATVEAELRTGNGNLVPYEFRNERLTAEDGVVVGAVGTGRDISDRKERERHLEQFSSVVSHDLRNPLNVADAEVRAAIESWDISHLENVVDAHDRMETIIDKLLFLAQTGREVGERSPVDLASVAETAWEHVETEAAELRLDCERTVDADYDQLCRLFENLFRNSVEHGTESGSDADVWSPGVTVSVSDTDDGFSVQDDGLGFPEEVEDDVFEWGFSTDESGSGLGLAIVEEIARAHEWDLAVGESAAGGARFEIRTD